MIHIFTALYPEAQPLIGRLGLSKSTGEHTFQQFLSGDGLLSLTVTGAGPSRAAAAVGYMLAKNPDCTIVNYGSCAGEKRGALYRCCKLTLLYEDRTFYPDLLFAGDLPEAEVVTQGTIWHHHPEKGEGNLPVLHDMEAAAIYEAGNLFVGPHKMHFLKFVSDFGEGERISAARLRDGSEQAADRAAKYIADLKDFEEREAQAYGGDPPLYEKLCTDLHASVTMKGQIRQLLLYVQLAGIDADKAVDKMYAEGKLPARDKRSGVRALRELKDRLL